MAKKSVPQSPLTIERLRSLSTLLSGDGLERLADELTDPGCTYSPGERIHLAVELRLLADHLETSGKNDALDVVRGGVGASAILTDASVVFEYKAPGTTTNIDEPEFRHQYPEDEYPSLYGPRKIDTTAVRKAFPPKEHPGIYKVTDREERVDVKT